MVDAFSLGTLKLPLELEVFLDDLDFFGNWQKRPVIEGKDIAQVVPLLGPAFFVRLEVAVLCAFCSKGRRN